VHKELTPSLNHALKDLGMVRWHGVSVGVHLLHSTQAQGIITCMDRGPKVDGAGFAVSVEPTGRHTACGPHCDRHMACARVCWFLESG
jgi:hypothetical protein